MRRARNLYRPNVSLGALGSVLALVGITVALRRVRFSFEPLGQAPPDKQLVLGLVSTKSPREETADELIARIEEAAQSFPREQLGVSTQCGFASVADGNPISEDAEQRKLRLVAEVARAAWG